ncbi:BMP family ABC transporter substrate-binding protein [Candidatus Poribacteria bacterium]|nr:MAG: BMP family ABC transporter substrate-binding protein [Candidatus Poribacteria bacterium]
MNYLNILKNASVLVFGLLLIYICGCQRVQDTIVSEPHDAMGAAPVSVSVVYPGDCLGDFAYCDVLYNGIQKAKTELSVEITEMESNFETWDMQLRAAAEHSGLVITSGYQMRDPVLRVAPEFPEVMFVIFDAAVDLPNVVSFTHRVNEGTFLLGAIAGLKSKTGKVGYLGGANVPLLHEFEAGYLAGVKAVNPEAEIMRGYVADDQQGFYDPVKGQEIATTQYESGVDVIYAMADQSGFGAIEAAKMAEGRYVIWNYIDITDVAPGIVLTGLRVGIDASAYSVIQEFATGSLMAGVRSLGLAEDNVGYLLTEGNKGLLSDALLEKVEALKASIIVGEIAAPMVPETGIQGTVIPPTTSEDDDEMVTEPNVEGTIVAPVGGAPDTP